MTDDEGEINYYALQYNPDEDYARSITYIYQRLCGYLKFDDVRILTGLSKKELKKKLKEKQIVAMYDEDAVRQAFDEDIAKG